MTSSPATDDRDLAALDALVTGLMATRTAIASLQAYEVTLLAAAESLAAEQTAWQASTDSREREMPRRAIAAEIGAATRVNDRTVQHRMAEAAALTGDYPRVVTALGKGRIDRRHVTVILDTGASLTGAADRGEFETIAVALAERETPGRLRPLLRTLAARLDPASIDTRHADAQERRDVWVQDLDDGMAQLIAALPAAIAHAVRDRLTRFARTVIDARDPGSDVEEAGRSGTADTRTIEQLRADVLADLLLTTDPTVVPRTAEPIVATVQVVVPALTLIGIGGDTDVDTGHAVPAELVGHAPIDTATARRLAGTAAGRDRLLTHPVTGAILTVDRYRPSEEQRRLLRARDEHCRFPGCRMPVHRCDLDHTTDAAHGGPTSTCNLAHLCKRHHILKPASEWTVIQHPDGTLEWTSPTGRTHHDHPPGTVRFRPSGDPPPF